MTMNNPQEMMQALIDGETLESFNCKLAKLEDGNFVCDEGYEVPNFKNHTSWDVRKEPAHIQGNYGFMYAKKARLSNLIFNTREELEKYFELEIKNNIGKSVKLGVIE